MTTQLSPLAIQHFTDNNGNLLAGGQLYTYAAGTSTPLATYTDSTGGTANANPVIMNARGEANVWTTSGLSYKFVLKDVSGVTIWTVDNITDGSLDSALAAALANNTDPTKGAALVGYIRSEAGAVGQKLPQVLGNFISVTNFGADPTGGTDSTAEILAADLAATNAGLNLLFPNGTYLVSLPGIQSNGATWIANGKVTLKAAAQTWSTSLQYLVQFTSKSNFSFQEFTVDVSAVTFAPGSGNPGNVFNIISVNSCSYFSIKNNTFDGIVAHVNAIALNYALHFEVSGNEIAATASGSYNQGILVSSASGVSAYGLIANNRLFGSGAFFDMAQSVCHGNIVSEWQFGGGLVFGPSATCKNNVISKNICFGSTGKDINLTYPNGIENWSPNSTIVGNICYSNSGSGIGSGGQNCTISGNTCFNNNQSNQPAVGGIVTASAGTLPYETGSYSSITGNVCYDDQTTKTQLYGYAEYVSGGGTLVDTVVEGNSFHDNATAPVLLAATNVAYTGPTLIFTYGISSISITAGGFVTYSVPFSAANVQDVVSVSSISGAVGGASFTTSIPTNGTIDLTIHNFNSSPISIGGTAYFNFIVKKTGNSPSY